MDLHLFKTVNSLRKIYKVLLPVTGPDRAPTTAEMLAALDQVMKDDRQQQEEQIENPVGFRRFVQEFNSE